MPRTLLAALILAPFLWASSGIAQTGMLQAPGSPERPDSLPRGEQGFYWTRAIFSGPLLNGLSNGQMITVPGWAADYPKSDEQLTIILNRLMNMDTAERANAVRLDDRGIRRFPMIYAAEVGLMDMTEAEIQGLRSYLEAGGFLMVDDFWGPRDMFFFSEQMRRVLPDREMKELPMDHPVFHQSYEIDSVEVVPNLDNLRAGRLYERGATSSHVFGIHDDDGRLMVLANFNTDLGDAWEWAESPDYPLTYSTYASQIVVNAILYVMSH